jgi:Ca2+-binding RTX toxin-like protein
VATVVGTAGNDTLAGTAGNDSISGLAGNDTIIGSGGADTIDGGEHFDTIDFAGAASAIVVDFVAGTITGGSGTTRFTNIERVVAGNFNDQLTGDTAAQILTGRAGSDTLWGAGGVDTLWGGTGADRFIFRETGTANADVIGDWASGSDKLLLDGAVMTALGAAGNFAAGDARFWSSTSGTAHDADDRIVYNTTTRQIFYDADGSGSGAAQLIATLQSGATLVATDIAVEGGSPPPPPPGQTINGTPRDDSLVGGPGNDTITGGDGWDTVDGAGGNDWIDGGANHDWLRGGDGDDTLFGGGGSNSNALEGGNGNDRLEAGPGGGSMHGDDGNDLLLGNASWDTLDGGAGIDTMEGGAGPDTYYVTAGDAITDSGTDRDQVYSDASWVLAPEFENLHLIGTAAINGQGNSLDNYIAGNDAANRINPGTGSDRIYAAGGNDTIDLPPGDGAWADEVDGGDGVDLLNLAGYMQSAVVVDLTPPSEWSFGTLTGGGVGGTGSASLSRIENVIADAFSDRLTGSDVSNVLDGRGGNDTLDGSGGNDTLIGDAGSDHFVFTDAPGAAHADRIVDFVSRTDRIDLNISAPDLGPSGDFAAGDARFFAAAGATSGHDASDRVVYDTSTGNLYYDSDGSGSAPAQLIATLQGAPSLAATDISANGVVYQGGEGDDSLVGSGNSDLMSGGAGNDTLVGNSGDDTLLGGTGHDSLVGNLGADSMQGGDGNDRLEGVSGSDYWEQDWDWVNDQPLPGGDTLDGGLGNDAYYVGRNDVISDAGGIDTVYTAVDNYTLGAGLENLTYLWPPGSDGEGFHIDFSGNDLDNEISIRGLYVNSSTVLDGGRGNDTLSGSGGEDVFRFSLGDGDYGHDHLIGGGETSTIDFADARSAIFADLAQGTLVGGGTGGSGSATLEHIDNVIGGAFDDHIIGGHGFGEHGAARLEGRGGNDTLESAVHETRLDGGAGNDRLVSRGDDSLTGGTGADAFVFARRPMTPPEFDDLFTAVGDFSSAMDKIVLDAAFHSDIGAAGNFSAGDERFYAGSGATSGHDATDRVILDTSTGVLYYDADGSGAGASSVITRVNLASGSSPFAATDIAVERNSPDLLLVGTPGNDTLSGGGGSDTIDGGAGNDSLSGGDGADSITGGAGDDTLDGGQGADDLDGGDGNDTYRAEEGDELADSGGHDLVLAAADNWQLGAGLEDLTLTGTSQTWGGGNELANVIRINATIHATVFGGAGNDTIHGASGAFNVLHGGDGDDLIFGATVADRLSGGAGNDSMSSGSGNDAFNVFMSAPDGNYGQDTIDAGTGVDGLDFLDRTYARTGITADIAAGTATGGGPSGSGRITFTGIEDIWATPFADRISGDAGGNQLHGFEGDDTVGGGGGNDTLAGNQGGDTFVFAHYGDAHADQLDFTSGGDKIALDATAFTAIGAPGNFSSGDARFFAGAGASSGQDASDRVIFDTNTGKLYYDPDGSGAAAGQLFATTNSFYGVPVATDFVVIGTPAGGPSITGTAGNDTLAGTSGNDTIHGLGGNDLLLAGGSGGTDVIDGGEGFDTIEFADRATSAVVVDFGAGTITGGGPGTISFTGVERVVTGNFNDSLSGSAAAEILTGRAGADTLWGAGGADTLWGGGGTDRFIFRETGTANADRVSDWASGLDKLALDDAAMSALGATGNFSAADARFAAGAGFTSGRDASDRVVFDTSTGNLYYDSDGSGSGAAQVIATLQSGAALAATDIVVI